MRKGILPVLVLSLLLGLSFAQEKVEKKWAVALRDATVRNMPSTQGSILFIAKAGERLEVLEDMGLWLKVKRADGTVGYIWTKLVRIEVERVVKQAPSLAPAPKPSPQPAPKPSLRPSPSRFRPFGFSFNFDYAFVSPDDFNANVRGYNQFFSSIGPYLRVATTLDKPLEELKNVPEGGLEFTFYPNPRIGIGLGFSYLKGHKETVSNFSSTPLSMKVSMVLNADIYGPFLSFHLLFPTYTLNMDLFAKTGYLMGKFYQKIDSYISPPDLPEYIYFEDISKGSIDLEGGVKITVPVGKSAGIFLGASYRLLNFKDLEATRKSSYPSMQPTGRGKLYTYEVLAFTQQWASVLNFYPSGSNYRNLKPAEFNFSGFKLTAGMSFRF